MFTKAKFNEIKKVSKLVNALMNQARNHTDSRLGLKNISTAERQFLDDLKKNEESSIGFRDPQAKYYNVVLGTFIYFLLESQCMKFETSSDAGYDLSQVDKVKDKQIKDLFDRQHMNFNL
jgi:hypothetical protein